MDFIKVASWNVDGKGSPEEVDAILSKSSKTSNEQQPPHLVCVQQANLPGSGELKNFKWLCSGLYGSAILISKASTLIAESFQQVCEQICVAEVVTEKGVIIKVVSCYMPPASLYVSIELWPKLTEVIKQFPGNTTYIIAGDFNAEIGKEDVFPSWIDRNMIGPKLYHQISNENGKQLKTLAYNIHAKLTTTFGDKNSKEPFYTYKDGEEKSQRSFIMIPQPIKMSLQECKLSWHMDHRSAILEKSVKPTVCDSGVLPNIPSAVTVSTWNVQGASPFAVDKILSDLDLPVVCVQNVFLMSGDNIKTDNYTWFTSKKLWGKNVGILIKSSSNISMTDFHVVSENLCVGKIAVNGCEFKVVCCSLPSHSDSARFQEVTTKLMSLVESIPKETVFFVAGDFNTHAVYTILDISLWFDKGDENASTLQRLMKEFKMELPDTHRNALTHMSEKVKRNTSFVLMSPSCVEKYSFMRFIRMVPFFENGVVILSTYEFEVAYDKLVSGPANLEDAKVNEEKPGNVEHINGFTYVTKKFCRIKKVLSIGTTDHQAFRFLDQNFLAKEKKYNKSDLPSEIITKYKNSPPAMDELLRILGDGFIIYSGFLLDSSVPKGCWPSNVLTASFESLNRGSLFAECIDVLEENSKEPIKRLINFRWNGIVVYQEEGGKFINYKRIVSKGQAAFTSVLGQYYFTIKAKRGFQPPDPCDDKIKLDKGLRVVKREEFPPTATAVNVCQYIRDFLARDPQKELVFGPDFSFDNFLEPIRKYAIRKQLVVRIFKSKEDSKHFDYVSVFITSSPLEICKQLIVTPEHQDFRYQLIPPCGTEMDYFDWIAKWEEEVVPDEYYKPYEKSILEYKPSVVPQSEKKDIQKYILPGEGKETLKKKRPTGYIPKTIRNVDYQTQHKVTKRGSLAFRNGSMATTERSTNWFKAAVEETDLPQDIEKKYRETPPPSDQLRRILGDNFTLYYGFRQGGCVITNYMEILAETFVSNNRGGVLLENIEVIKKGQPCSRLVKFRWNGICIHQEEGLITESFKAVTRKGQTSLIDKLGQNFYTVRAKMSYFNKGWLPLCQDKEELSKTLKMVEKSELPPTFGIEDLKKFIDEQFSKKSDLELYFGPEIVGSELMEPLKKFAVDKTLGYRLMKSKEGVDKADSISIFVKHSLLEIRDRLMKLPNHQDMRFFLIPPCEFFKKSHYEWIKSWAAENFLEEFKLILEHEKTQSALPVNPPTQEIKKNSVPRNVNSQKKDSRKENSRSAPRPTARPVNLNQRSRNQKDYPRENYSRFRGSERNQSNLPARRSENNRGTMRSQPSRPGERKRDWDQMMDNYREDYRSQPSSRPEGYADNRSFDQDYYREPDPWADNRPVTQGLYQQLDGLASTVYLADTLTEDLAYGRTVSRGLYQEPDAYANNWTTNQQSQRQYQEPAGQIQVWQQPDVYERENYYSRPSGSDAYGDNRTATQRSYQEPDGYGDNRTVTQRSYQEPDGYGDNRTATQRSYQEPDGYGDNRTATQRSYQEPERYEPRSKRAKKQSPQKPGKRVDKPRWDDIGPLVIVWPVNIRSEHDRDSRRVLETNFPTDISLEANNTVAVHVTLPLRKGGEKKYCVTVGNSIVHATKTALDLIVKHSSVIKHTVTFLPPDGQVPNFIRYNIPCQTNPRTYILLSWAATGELTQDKIMEIFDSFICSLNEDLFFDKNFYSHEMKQMLLDMAPKFGLKVRHFGEDHRLAERYVCVYKTKPKDQVLEEVLKMRDFHPKYRLVVNKLPPRLGLNIF